MQTVVGVRGALSDGQVVTLLVGVGLSLCELHVAGRVCGPIHPAHVVVDATGRPRLNEVSAPPAWTTHDDWVALLRFGRVMGRTARTASLNWETARPHEGRALLRWLADWAAPLPLPTLVRQ